MYEEKSYIIYNSLSYIENIVGIKEVLYLLQRLFEHLKTLAAQGFFRVTDVPKDL